MGIRVWDWVWEELNKLRGVVLFLFMILLKIQINKKLIDL